MGGIRWWVSRRSNTKEASGRVRGRRVGGSGGISSAPGAQATNGDEGGQVGKANDGAQSWNLDGVCIRRQTANGGSNNLSAQQRRCVTKGRQRATQGPAGSGQQQKKHEKNDCGRQAGQWPSTARRLSLRRAKQAGCPSGLSVCPEKGGRVSSRQGLDGSRRAEQAAAETLFNRRRGASDDEAPHKCRPCNLVCPRNGFWQIWLRTRPWPANARAVWPSAVRARRGTPP